MGVDRAATAPIASRRPSERRKKSLTPSRDVAIAGGGEREHTRTPEPAAVPMPVPVAAKPVPVEYVEPAAEVDQAPPSAAPTVGGVTRNGWQTPSAEERARIERDPVVKQTLDLFDGAVIGFRAAPTTPPDEETE